MKARFAILVISLIQIISCIDTQCTDISNCPANSVCSGSYCQCSGSFILDCQTQATYLTSSFQDLNVTDVTSYYQTQNQKPQVYYNFMFQTCCVATTLPNYNLSFSVWMNQGYPTLAQNQFIGEVRINLDDLVQAGTCIDFFQYQTKLSTQKNGQTENLIIGLSIQPKTPGDAVPDPSQIISMNVVIKELVSADFLIKLAIGIISACGFIIICIILFCCYRRWKAKQVEKQTLTLKQKMVEDFKKFTPQSQAKNISIPAMSTCSICLCQFEPEQKVRKVICRHIFHSECIDSWCMKNLNCPVCRLDLDQVSLMNKKKQIEMSDFKWKQNSLSDRQNLVQDSNQQP